LQRFIFFAESIFKSLAWFWFIFDLDNELMTAIDLKIDTNNTTLDYNTFLKFLKHE